MTLAGIAASQGLGAELGANLGDDEPNPLPIETTKSWALTKTSCSKGAFGHYDSLCYSGTCGYREITNSTYHSSPSSWISLLETTEGYLEGTTKIGDTWYYSTGFICMPSNLCNTTT